MDIPDTLLDVKPGSFVIYGPDDQELVFDDPDELGAWIANLSNEYDSYCKYHGCRQLVFAGDRINPPEYCEGIALPGDNYCVEHQEL